MANEKRRIRWFGSFALLGLLLILWFLGMPVIQMMQRSFEQTAFEQVIRQLNRACSEVVIKAKASESAVLSDWIGRNPVDCLDDSGLSSWAYLGDETNPDVQPSASWIFDQQESVLRYRWRDAEGLINQDPQADLVRLALRAEFADTNQNGIWDAGEAINGLYLEPVYEYQWLD